MRPLLLAVVLAACAASPAPAPQAPAPATPCPAPPVAAATPAPAPLAADRDDAAIIASSHAVFDAMDRFDADTVAAALAPGFALYSEARILPGSFVVDRLRAQARDQAPARTRTWRDEHVLRTGDVVTYIGESTVSVPASGDVPAHQVIGFSTLVWSRGAEWRVAHAAWDRHDESTEKERWNDWLVTAPFNRKPNQTLVEAIKGRKPGKALDIAMGQGRNAIFLASQGWKTTGVDFADAGIKIAKDTAAQQKLQLETIQADIETWDLGTNRWDLVTLIYAGADPKEIDRVKKGLKKGGLFVAEYFHVDSAAEKDKGAGGFVTGELAAAFKDGYKILRDEVVRVERPDWGPPNMMIQRFVAQKL